MHEASVPDRQKQGWSFELVSIFCITQVNVFIFVISFYDLIWSIVGLNKHIWCPCKIVHNCNSLSSYKSLLWENGQGCQDKKGRSYKTELRWPRLPYCSAVLGMATGTRTRHLESTAPGLGSLSSSSAACPLARCAAPMRSHRPMGSGRPSLVSRAPGGAAECRPRARSQVLKWRLTQGNSKIRPQRP